MWHVEVAKRPGADSRTVQGGLDIAATLSSPTTPVLVSVGKDRFTEVVLANVSNVALVGEDQWQSILERPSTDTSWPGGFAFSGGTLSVGCYPVPGESESGDEVVDVLIQDLHIIRNHSGFLTPPEAALFIGTEEIYPSTTRHWNRVTVRGCVIEGIHDGIQFFGISELGATTNGLELPQLLVENNIVFCTHDASTFKGMMRVLHQHNHLRVRSQGDLYLTNIWDWKTTGIHLNIGRGVSTSGVETGAEFVSFHDQIDIENGENVALTGDQSTLSGIYVYGQNGASLKTMPRVCIDTPSIDLKWNRDATPERRPSGVAVISVDDPADSADEWSIADGRFKVNGGRISVWQKNTGSSAPDDVAGVLLRGGNTVSSSRILRVVGTEIHVKNDKAASNAYCLQTECNDDEIRAHIFSEQASAGNVTAATKVTT